MEHPRPVKTAQLLAGACQPDDRTAISRGQAANAVEDPPEERLRLLVEEAGLSPKRPLEAAPFELILDVVRAALFVTALRIELALLAGRGGVEVAVPLRKYLEDLLRDLFRHLGGACDRPQDILPASLEVEIRFAVGEHRGLERVRLVRGPVVVDGKGCFHRVGELLDGHGRCHLATERTNRLTAAARHAGTQEGFADHSAQTIRSPSSSTSAVTWHASPSPVAGTRRPSRPIR